MSTDEILKSAFADGLGLDTSELEWDTLEYRGIPAWDSVAHMQVVAEIEDRFDIMLDVDDVIAMSSFTISKQILAKYGIEFR